jgi:hypothetical protein
LELDAATRRARSVLTSLRLLLEVLEAAERPMIPMQRAQDWIESLAAVARASAAGVTSGVVSPNEAATWLHAEADAIEAEVAAWMGWDAD